MAKAPLRPVRSLRALIVDDDRVALSVLSSVLRSIGVVQTLQAVNGEDALNLFQGANPPVDFVVCDDEMPRMNGVALLKSLRDGGHSTPFLMLAASSDASSVTAGREAGLTAYITKPFTPAQIERKVRILLQPITG